jgi:hypothetical protein
MSEQRLSARARYVIGLLKNPDQEVYLGGPYRDGTTRSYSVREWCQHGKDDGWFVLYRIPNIGLKTITELVAAEIIEMMPGNPRAYRLAKSNEGEQDFGDLWIAA